MKGKKVVIRGWMTVYQKGKRQPIPLKTISGQKKRPMTVASVVPAQSSEYIFVAPKQGETHYRGYEVEWTQDEGYAKASFIRPDTQTKVTVTGSTTSEATANANRAIDNVIQEIYMKKQASRPDVRPLIYTTSIGHYGGLYVYLPEENLATFKTYFPPNTFPRKIQIKDVTKEWTFEGEQHYRAKFPNSNKVAIVHFAHASKGEQFLDENLKMPVPD